MALSVRNHPTHFSEHYIWHSIRYQFQLMHTLTHWGRVTHICVNKLAIIVLDNGLSPDRRQAIISTNTGILLIRIPGANFSEMHIFSFKKMHLKVSSAKWRPFCLGLNVLTMLQTTWAIILSDLILNAQWWAILKCQNSMVGLQLRTDV